MEPLIVNISATALLGVPATVFLGVIGWYIKRQISASDTTNSALNDRIERLGVAINEMTTQNAVSASLFAQCSRDVVLLFKKTDELEHTVSTIEGICQTNHGGKK